MTYRVRIPGGGMVELKHRRGRQRVYWHWRQEPRLRFKSRRS